MKGNTHSDPVRVEQVLGTLVWSWLGRVAGWAMLETITEDDKVHHDQDLDLNYLTHGMGSAYMRAGLLFRLIGISWRF